MSKFGEELIESAKEAVVMANERTREPITLVEKQYHWLSVLCVFGCLFIAYSSRGQPFAVVLSLICGIAFFRQLFVGYRKIVVNYELQEVQLYACRLWDEKLDEVIAIKKARAVEVICVAHDDGGPVWLPYLIGESGTKYALLTGGTSRQIESTRIATGLRKALGMWNT